MKKTTWNGFKITLVTTAALLLGACVEIKSDTKVAADAKVNFTTTYDVSKIVTAMQMSNKGSADEMAKNVSCEKMNEQLTKEYSCKDLGLGKFVVSGVFDGDVSNGVTLDKEKNQLSVDAVQLFRKVADLNPAKQSTDATDPASVLMQKGLVPVAADQAAQYKQIGMILALNITLPADVLTVDGVEAKDIKDNTVSVNFIDVAGKDTYIVTSKTGKNNIWQKILFVLLAIALLLAAVLYLLKRRNKKPQAPAPMAAAVVADSEVVDSEMNQTAEVRAVTEVIDTQAAEQNDTTVDLDKDSTDGSTDSSNHDSVNDATENSNTPKA